MAEKAGADCAWSSEGYRFVRAFIHQLLPVAALAAALALSGCSATSVAGVRPGKPAAIAAAAQLAGEGDPRSSADLDGLIAHYAAHYAVPESLIRRVIVRESGYNPAARNGPYWGLMQILPSTARTMGYQGEAAGLLSADTNLKYAVKYLAGAYMVGGGNPDAAMRFYASGYYYDAKRLGLLEETGLR